jgi:ABC-2 type transport system permease protein
VLAGHILGNVIQTMLAGGLVIVVAVLVGWRAPAGIVEWLAVIGLLGLASLAVSALCVALGLSASSVETASNTPMFLMILLFVSSAFVPIASMPELLQAIARINPITPIVETVRGLLYGVSIGTEGPIAVCWCVAITLASYTWAMRLFERLPARAGS